MNIRIQGHVASELVREFREAVDTEIGAKDALQGDAPDPGASEAGEVPKGASAEARRARDIGHG
jgi:hypothetical protein